jgi:flagellar M-ring protein FliF
MEQVQTYWSQLVATVRAFREANRTRFNLIAATAALTAAIGAAFYVLDPGAPVVLTANLSPADRTALALRLRRHGIGFQLGADSISVPWHELRQAQRLLDGSPGFNGGENGLGLFDRSRLGQSDFDEQVNYQRSLQGELERTIMDLRGIDSARVMLAMGQPSPFALGESTANHASVMLTTSSGTNLDATMARAIAHLVASSVRGLSTENVTVTANDGMILYPIQHDGEMGDALRLRNDIEHRLEQKVSALLSRIMGAARYAASRRPSAKIV